MENLIFSKDALIEIQGEDVLQVQSILDDHVIYQVVGFNNPCIIIRDFRSEEVTKLKQSIKNEDVCNLAKSFNKQSRVSIKRNSESILVELHNSEAKFQPRFMLWIASEYKRVVPMFRYRIFKSVLENQGKYRLFSLYKRPYQRGKHQPVPFSPG